MESKLFAIVAGAGTGTGRAVALRFAKTYPVVLLARTPGSYQDTVAEIKRSGGTALGILADAADAESMDSAFETMAKELPGLKLAVAVYNVGGGYTVKPFLDTKLEDFDLSVEGNARGFFIFAQKTIPLLLDAVAASEHAPTMLITGATASIRGSAKFSTIASGMSARRALGQSLAREFGPRGVHVAHAIVDGVIDIPRNKNYIMNGGLEHGKLSPDAVSAIRDRMGWVELLLKSIGQIAESYWHLHTQHRSAFTQELDMRPFLERF